VIFFDCSQLKKCSVSRNCSLSQKLWIEVRQTAQKAIKTKEGVLELKNEMEAFVEKSKNQTTKKVKL
jgi:hypothetical protein